MDIGEQTAYNPGPRRDFNDFLYPFWTICHSVRRMNVVMGVQDDKDDTMLRKYAHASEMQ